MWEVKNGKLCKLDVRSHNVLGRLDVSEMSVVGLLGSVFGGKVCHHGHARGADDQ